MVSEGAKYGSLLAAVADTDSEKGLHPVPAAQNTLYERRRLLDTIYHSSDSTNVTWAAHRLGVSYILQDSLEGMLPARIDPKDELVFTQGPYRILKLK